MAVVVHLGVGVLAEAVQDFVYLLVGVGALLYAVRGVAPQEVLRVELLVKVEKLLVAAFSVHFNAVIAVVLFDAVQDTAHSVDGKRSSDGWAASAAPPAGEHVEYVRKVAGAHGGVLCEFLIDMSGAFGGDDVQRWSLKLQARLESARSGVDSAHDTLRAAEFERGALSLLVGEVEALFLEKLPEVLECDIVVNDAGHAEFVLLCDTGGQGSELCVDAEVLPEVYCRAEYRRLHRREVRKSLLAVFEHIINDSRAGLRDELLSWILLEIPDMRPCADIRAEGDIVDVLYAVAAQEFQHVAPAAVERHLD